MDKEIIQIEVTSKMSKLLRELDIDEKYLDVNEYYKRYSGLIINYDSDKIPSDECIALDLPAFIKSNVPIREKKNPCVAIVGEAPSRKDIQRHLGQLSVGITFGQNDLSYYLNQRVYDKVINFYLNQGFDVYVTNLSKTLTYKETNGKYVPQPIPQNDESMIEELQDEFDFYKPCHIIWLGDSQWKKFIYGEAANKLHIDWTCFPHPSGSNNNAWKCLFQKHHIEDDRCTNENKTSYIVSMSNVLYEGNDGTLHSTLEIFETNDKKC